MPKYRSRLREAAIAFLFVAVSACAGKSCSCVQPIKGGFPVAQRHENAIQVRATASLFQYLSQHGATLIPGLIGGNMFTIPPSCSGTTQVCCAMPNQVCQLSFDFQTLSLQPSAPKTLHLSTDLIVKTVQDLPVSIPVIGACTISIDTTKGSPQTMNVAADLAFTVDAMTDTTGLSASGATVNIQDAAINLSGGFGCSVANFVLFKPIIVSVLQSTVASELQTLIGGAACSSCTTKDDCNSLASDCKNGQCVEADGTTCVPSLGIEGKVDVGSILASFSPSTKASMDFLAVAGGYAHADSGLSLGMLGGALGDPHSSCVPMTAAPLTPKVLPSQTFVTDVLPDQATPYHLGIGLHVSELNNIGWGVFDSGGLCLDVGTAQVAQLSASTLGLVMPSLQKLTHADDAPMKLQLKPTGAPTFTLGRGTFTVDKNGQNVVADPLLSIFLPQLSIDFYAFVDQRYVRVLTMTADVTLPLSLQVDAGGTLTPLFGDLSSAFQNVVVTNSSLLAESPNSLAQAFPTLLAVAVGQIAGSLKNIALPALMGLQISPIAITSTDPDANGLNQFLAIFADLAAATTTPALVRRDALQVTLARLTLPPTREFAVDARGTTEPSATLLVDAAAGPSEYAWSLDGGPWSPFSRGPELVVRDPRLWLQGRHVVDVRARAVGVPASTGAATRLPLLIDTVAPTGRFDVAGGELSILDAHDAVSPPSALQARVAVAGGSFGEWTAAGRLPVPAGAAATALRVQLRDEAGNVAELTASGDGASGGGCSVVGGPARDATPAALALVALTLLLGRRRLRAGLLALIAVAGCSSHGLTKGDFANPVDEIGRFSDLVVDGHGTVHASAYDDNYGDLVYAQLRSLTTNPSWQIVDGVDLSLPPDIKGGYRHGIPDPGDDVGQYTSLALTSSGSPRIAYFDVTHHALKFALGPHPFASHTVDVGSAAEQVGMYAALSLDGHDVPSIAYVATDIADGDGFKSELRVATATSSHPSSAKDWTVTVVDSSPIPCAGLCAGTSACITPAMVNGMANSDPSLSTCVAVDAAPCPTTCTATQACIAATCTTFVAAGGAPALLEGTGLFVNALRDQSGQLALVYYDKEGGALKLATRAGAGAWSPSFLDGPTAGVDVGQFASAAYAADGSLHVTYADATHGALLYKQIAGGVVPMTADVIDDGTRADGSHVVGGGANLVLDASGGPRVVYQDQTSSDLEQATHAAGAWSHAELDSGEAGFGFYPHQRLAAGQIYMSEFVYDHANGPGNPLGTLRFSSSK